MSDLGPLEEADCHGQADLIAAIATAIGPGAVGLVRLSGQGAALALEKAFVSPTSPASRPRSMVFGKLVHPTTRAILDHVLAAFFPSPCSFTGEDTAEIFCHGGHTVPRLILEAFLATGARLANPGEFTQRAFLNGRLGLDQAEAVAELVAAQSEAEAALATRHLEGALSRRIRPAMDGLLGLKAELAAILDFEEDWDEAKSSGLLAKLDDLLAELTVLRNIRVCSRVFRDGLRLVLAGRPNAGKSSLFNALVGRDRALVSPRPGTTRDFLEAAISWGGLRVELVDTAGLGDCPDDELEARGQELARRELEEADVVIWLRPANDPGPDPPTGLPAAKVLEATSKADLASGPSLPERPSLSALTGQGLDNLKTLVLEMAGVIPDQQPEAVPNLRQQKALEDCLKCLSHARQALLGSQPPDIISLEIGAALESLDQITGQILSEDLLAEVFSRFCVGK
ncbi:MAG: tRNA uridine-5-carboxymethylaminomethyl(34) synthesis GTPase MnmE [Deltaproteobacteria bacterium]|nr:tRNA uridine-5-carboxymethylaminomethyl(34) synthesis GTPase MnmE [Deltaproteobacteria bacterium]